MNIRFRPAAKAAGNSAKPAYAGYSSSPRRRASYLLPAALAAGFVGHANAQPVTIQIDATKNRHPISPLIYGVNWGGAVLKDLNSPLNRLGGNATTRYNWQQNASNRGNDWFFQSVAEAGDAPSAMVDNAVKEAQAQGGRTMVTIPTVGWVAKINPANREQKLWSYSVAKYGAQQKTDQWNPDSGNGSKPDGTNVTGNDPTDANLKVDAEFMRPWIQHLKDTFGEAKTGAISYYVLDNEPALWNSTHRDVQAQGVTLEEMWARSRDTARVIKSVDPSAQVVGPEEWGWTGFQYSGADSTYGGAHNWQGPLPDRSSHGDIPAVAWMLQQFANEEKTSGKRLLDVFSLHFYPQGGEFGDDVSEAMQLRRNRSTRALWDENYKDETWINDQVKLIPRMKEWVQTYYPNTPIGITEYSWGAENHINGATAQADILGIFGRENLDLGTRWVVPATGSPTYNVFKMYRNVDGKNGGFGDVAVLASAPVPDELSAFAAQDSKTGALTIMVINKIARETPVSLKVAGFRTTAPARGFQLTSVNQIMALPVARTQNSVLSFTAPAQSITLWTMPRR